VKLLFDQNLSWKLVRLLVGNCSVSASAQLLRDKSVFATSTTAPTPPS